MPVGHGSQYIDTCAVDSERGFMKVVDYEKIVDKYFFGLELGNNNYSKVMWTIGNVFEDLMRWHCFAFIDIAKKKELEYRHIMMITTKFDEFKYGFKHALANAKQNTSYDNVNFECSISGDEYKCIHQLCNTSMEFADISKAFIAYYRGFSNCKLSNNVIEFRMNIDNVEYSALEYFMINKGSNAKSAFEIVIDQLLKDHLKEQILQSSWSENDYISYKVEPNAFRFISDSLSPMANIIPESWNFPQFNVDQLRTYFINLQALCIYHFLTINYRSEVDSIVGGGLEQLCIFEDFETFIATFEKLSGTNPQIIKAITRFLIYGKKVTNPDPALQPLLIIGSKILIPCMHVITSNYERNALSLHARVDSTSFDKNSRLFEIGMTNKLLSSLHPSYRHRNNFTIPKFKTAGEIDLIVADECSKILLVCELRWMIPPGDPNEILDRKKVCNEKVDQAYIKINAVMRNKEYVIDSLGLKTSLTRARDWKVFGCVIIEGFAGSRPKQKTKIPIIPINIFQIGISTCSGLKELVGWMTSEQWLPKEDIHFHRDTKKTEFGGITILSDGVGIQNPSPFSEEYVKLSIVNYRYGAIMVPEEKIPLYLNA